MREGRGENGGDESLEGVNLQNADETPEVPPRTPMRRRAGGKGRDRTNGLTRGTTWTWIGVGRLR